MFPRYDDVIPSPNLNRKRRDAKRQILSRRNSAKSSFLILHFQFYLLDLYIVYIYCAVIVVLSPHPYLECNFDSDLVFANVELTRIHVGNGFCQYVGGNKIWPCRLNNAGTYEKELLDKIATSAVDIAFHTSSIEESNATWYPYSSKIVKEIRARQKIFAKEEFIHNKWRL